uniref:Uncharacterized protein n=1 Tax=Chromera velia CCMP2878 TaxID=1169474 RepID=A0A0G4HHV9_9ALVE|eukprot:Cvel_27642.t1-p1 / transcript=Cvel_27642.t1 / gene=Cvel_27642 / organism=Chromera_velia_CCMP2878 / gene_product=hypothetical protein / transcript_product=hypothetical protein / location=Cvel_scaffold3479:15423-15965(+) / protein_length=181 / sequence_SO=supercontig / SO=protein_coding / is_pseudo=false
MKTEKSMFMLQGVRTLKLLSPPPSRRQSFPTLFRQRPSGSWIVLWENLCLPFLHLSLSLLHLQQALNFRQATWSCEVSSRGWGVERKRKSSQGRVANLFRQRSQQRKREKEKSFCQTFQMTIRCLASTCLGSLGGPQPLLAFLHVKESSKAAEKRRECRKHTMIRKCREYRKGRGAGSTGR